MDDGKGALVAGPGAGGLQPRPSEAKRALPKLTRPQEEALAKAKRYAMEMSVQHVCSEEKMFVAFCKLTRNISKPSPPLQYYNPLPSV